MLNFFTSNLFEPKMEQKYVFRSSNISLIFDKHSNSDIPIYALALIKKILMTVVWVHKLIQEVVSMGLEFFTRDPFSISQLVTLASVLKYIS